MTDERLIIAIGRLERALTRVETAAAARSDEQLVALSRRHQRLRTRTQEAIAALDTLTGSI